jgi:hypothetical protein
MVATPDSEGVHSHFNFEGKYLEESPQCAR